MASALWIYRTDIRPMDNGTLTYRAIAIPVRCVQHLPGKFAFAGPWPGYD